MKDEKTALRPHKRKETTIGVYIALSMAAIVIFMVIFGVMPSSCSSDAVKGQRKDAEDEATVRQMVNTQIEVQSIEENDIPEALAATRSANPDACAWLYVLGTDVSLPVMRHSDDDSFYTDHLSDGSEGILGAAFVEHGASPYFIDPVTVVCGHAFEDAINVMMGELHLFESTDFFDTHDEFRIYLTDRVLTYRIASACSYVGDNILTYVGQGDEATLQTYMEGVIDPGIDERFVRDVGEINSKSDRVVQLSTCTLPPTAEARYVVTGVLVDSDPL